MRVMARMTMPVESGNIGVQTGLLPKLIQETADRWKPEAMYFTTFEGTRTAYIFFEMADSSGIPLFAEPFFTQLNAELEIMPVMNVEDLQKGLAQAG
jgi:hypothetical protein